MRRRERGTVTSISPTEEELNSLGKLKERGGRLPEKKKNNEKSGLFRGCVGVRNPKNQPVKREAKRTEKARKDRMRAGRKGKGSEPSAQQVHGRER